MTTTEDKYTFPRAITKDIDIHKACRAGDIPKIRTILSKCPSLINYQDDRLGWTPLYRATMSGYYDTVAVLLEHKADPNIKNNIEETPLHQAADNGLYKIAETLLLAGADPNAQQNDGDTPLHLACFKGDYKMVDTLLKYKANPNTKNNTLGRTPLHLAYDGGHQTIAELLEANGAMQDQKDNVGKTPLEYSAQNFSSTQKCHDTEQSLSTTKFCERYLGGTSEKSQKVETFDEFLKRTMTMKSEAENDNPNVDSEENKDDDECNLPMQLSERQKPVIKIENANSINPLNTEDSQNNGRNLKQDLDTLIEEDSRLECSTDRKHCKSIISVNKESIAQKTDLNSRSVIDFRASKIGSENKENQPHYSDFKAMKHIKNESISDLQAITSNPLFSKKKEHVSIIENHLPESTETTLLNYSKLSEITHSFVTQANEIPKNVTQSKSVAIIKSQPNDIPPIIGHGRPGAMQSDHKIVHEMYNQLMNSIQQYSKDMEESSMMENEEGNQKMDSKEFAKLLEMNCTKDDSNICKKGKANVPHISVLKQGYGCPPPSKRDECDNQLTFRQIQQNDAFNEWLKSINCTALESQLYAAGISSKETLLRASGDSMELITAYLKKIGINKLGFRTKLTIKLMEESGELLKYLEKKYDDTTGPANTFGCCTAPYKLRTDFVEVYTINKWLDSLRLGHLLYNFVNNGFEEMEHLLLLMNTEQPLNKAALYDDLGIEDEKENARILSKLCEVSQSYFLSTLVQRYGLKSKYESKARSEGACACIII